MISFSDFEKLDIRVGKIVEVNDFPEARKPSYSLKIDLGPAMGVKKSCAQLALNYSKEELIGKFVLCLINLPSKQVGPRISEVLTLGLPDDKGECILITPDRALPLGGKLY